MTAHHQRHFGCLPDKPDPRDKMLSARAALESPIARADQELRLLEMMGDHIRDQRTTPFCTGFSTAYLLEARRAVDGQPRVLVSPRALYQAGCQHEGIDYRNGCWNRAVVRAAFVRGAPREDRFPLTEDPARFGDEPDEYAQIEGFARAHGEYLRLDGAGEARVEFGLDQLQRARPFNIGMEATDAYQRCRDDRTVPAPRPEEFQGRGHSIFIGGFRDGGEAFASWSSWSRSHGDNGIVWLHRDWLASALTRDCWIAAEASA